MTRIRPFHALRYDPARDDLGELLVPPYDVIAPDERARLYDRNPHSAIRLELTREVEREAQTDYADVAQTFGAWRRDGVLRRDETPALYALRQRFVAPDGGRHEREGFFALLHLEDYERRIVRPHERTLAAPKADRLKLLRATRANLSAVFLLYEDREGELPARLGAEAGSPLFAARDEVGSEHALTRVGDPQRVEAVASFLAERPLVIADGHHRYETALAYRDEQRAAGAGPEADSEWLLVYLANAFAPGSLLLPTHRLIRKSAVPTAAAWERLVGWSQRALPVTRADEIPALLAEHLAPLREGHAFAADDASGTLRIFSKPRAYATDLTVRAVHEEVIDGVFGLDEDAVRQGAIGYPKDALRTARDLRDGSGVVALYLNALTPDEVFQVTAAGEVLPQKTTFFFPKLPTGLLFRALEDDVA